MAIAPLTKLIASLLAALCSPGVRYNKVARGVSVSSGWLDDHEEEDNDEGEEGNDAQYNPPA